MPTKYKNVEIPEGWFRLPVGACVEEGDMFWSNLLLKEGHFAECEPWLNLVLPNVMEDDFVIRKLDQ